MSTTTSKHSPSYGLAYLVALACIVILFLIAVNPGEEHNDFQPQKTGQQMITTVDVDGWSRDLSNRLNDSGTYKEQIAILANSWCATGMALTAMDPNVRNAATLQQIGVSDFVRQAELQWTDKPVVTDYQAATQALCGFTPDAPYGGG